MPDEEQKQIEQQDPSSTENNQEQDLKVDILLESEKNLQGRSKNYIRTKTLRLEAQSLETFQKLKDNPYFEIWDCDYYSTTD